MQLATVMLALAGDRANTIQKFDVTPSEVAVLQRIHGTDAVFDIAVTGDDKRTNRQERERLTEAYGKMTVDGQYESPAVNSLFPGAAARLFETFDELELDESLLAAPVPAGRAAPAAPVEPVAPEPAPKRGKKAEAKPTALPVDDEHYGKGANLPAAAEDADENDDIGEMPDAGLFGDK